MDEILRQSPTTLRQSPTVEELDGDDEFEISSAVGVNNPALGIDVVIRAPFLKVVEDDDGRINRFVLLDFYQSRGIYALMSCRLPPEAKAGRKYSKLLAIVVGGIRRKRDEQFRESVKNAAPVDIRTSSSTFKGPKSVLPRDRALKAIAFSKSDAVDVALGELSKESDGRIIKCLLPLHRKNGQTELWVSAEASTWDVLSKIALYEYRKNNGDVGFEQAAVDAPNHATSPVDAEPVETPVASRHSSKRRSTDDSPMTGSPVEKRQASLLSFMKPNGNRDLQG